MDYLDGYPDIHVHIQLHDFFQQPQFASNAYEIVSLFVAHGNGIAS